MHGFHGLRHYGATAPSGPVNGRSHKGAPQPIPRPPSIPIPPPARPPRRSAIAEPVGLPGRPRWSTRSAYNFHYFGHPLAFGPSVVASAIALSKTGSAHLWQSSWRESLPGLLFSPARGLVWFSPVLVLGLVSAVAVWRDPRFRALIPLQLGTVLMILVSGKWFDWWGGLTWGYRPIVDAAPFLALLMVPIVERIVASRPRRVVCGALLVCSIAVQFVGAYSYSLMGWSDLWRRVQPARAGQPVALGPPPDRLPPRQLQLRASPEKAGNGHLPEPPRPDPQLGQSQSKHFSITATHRSPPPPPSSRSALSWHRRGRQRPSMRRAS